LPTTIIIDPAEWHVGNTVEIGKPRQSREQRDYENHIWMQSSKAAFVSVLEPDSR